MKSSQSHFDKRLLDREIIKCFAAMKVLTQILEIYMSFFCGVLTESSSSRRFMKDASSPRATGAVGVLVETWS